MADVNVIVGQAGPLPIKVSAEIDSDGPAVLTLAGSVWTPTEDRMIGVSLAIDGQPPAVSARIFSNGSSTHRAVVPITFPYTFTIGTHPFVLEPMTADTTSDGNDFFVLTVQY